jgi:uncharacterized protein
MVEYSRRSFRRAVLKTYRFLKHPRRLKKSRVLKWFSRHFLDKRVWRPTQHTLAGGLAIGMFITSIILPGQMPLAVVLAGVFRVNVPIAVVACWLSNPFTYAPMIFVEVKIGEWFLRLLGMQSDGAAAIVKAQAFFMDAYRGQISWPALWHRFYELLSVAKELYIGAFVVACVLAVLSYIVAYGLWAMMAGRSRPSDEAMRF